MSLFKHLALFVFLSLFCLLPVPTSAEDCNLRVITDASPDYTDLPSLVHSVTAQWPTPEQQCFAMFYWNHLARRQTQPMELHGTALTDPIRQFNDYGFTMCSTISGINQSIWEQMGLKHKYWDISNHTVCEVIYDGRAHMYDNSLSALYTLEDGKTIAGVEDIGKEGSGPETGGQPVLGYLAKYHCITSTGANGFLTGADCIRSMDEESRCFNPKALKFRTYYYDWDNGHRYILNLRENEVYTRTYHSLGDKAGFYVPNQGKDPESVNPRYHIRGNGLWTWTPDLSPAGFAKAIHSAKGIGAQAGGVQPEKAGAPGWAIFKIQSANVTTRQTISATFQRKSADDSAAISISTSNGLHWKEIWKAADLGENKAKLDLIDEVNGAYEILIRVELTAKAAPADAQLKSLTVDTTTEINSKTQPKLNLGKNTVFVGAGVQTESIVFWPELQKDQYKNLIVEEGNVLSVKEHNGYEGAIYPYKPKEDAFIVYRLDAPNDITKLTYGGRFHNRYEKAHIDMLHSTDGKTWVKSWSLTSHDQPWDVIHYETVDIAPGNRAVYVKYVMNTEAVDKASPCSIYAVRMEADYLPTAGSNASAPTVFLPMEVTFHWSERQADDTLVARSHTQFVDKVPFQYAIDVGGEDQPIVDSLTVSLRGAVKNSKAGYSDGKDAGGKKYVGTWITCGKNLATGKSYTLSAPSGDNWEAGDPDGKKLTDGVVGPSYAGGVSFRYGAVWKAGVNPVITLDLGSAQDCASFGLNFHGYEPWDFLKGEVKDKIEVLVSGDGKEYKSLGFVNTRWRWKDVPVNFMIPDDETLCGATCRLIPPQPVKTRYVQYKVTSARFFNCTELEVLDAIRFDPFDLKITLPAP